MAQNGDLAVHRGVARRLDGAVFRVALNLEAGDRRERPGAEERDQVLVELLALLREVPAAALP